jgi:hypothetical protein
MKTILNLVCCSILIFGCTTSKDLTKSKNKSNKELPIITNVKFEKDKIILDSLHCYNYKLDGYNFIISDLNNVEIIRGLITPLENSEFRSVITFVALNTKFSNKKIIGRNDLIFALCQNNVLEKNCTINEEKLKEFLVQFNELK